MKTAIGVLIFSYFVEMLQYFNVVNVLGLQNSKVARVIIGTSFAWQDILAYTTGIIAVIVVENQKLPGKKTIPTG